MSARNGHPRKKAAGSRFANQDARVVDVFEIVGSYFVDTIFNHIYASARTAVTRSSSLTDQFIQRVKAYVVGVRNDKQCYEDVVRGVREYFMSTTRVTSLSFANFVDRIVGASTPPEYFEKMLPQDKDLILNSILCDLVSNLAVAATEPEMLRKIIDEHSQAPDVTIRMLQDSALSILLEKRESLSQKFLKKAGQAREHVSVDLVSRLQKALRRLVKDKADALARAQNAESELEEAKSREKKLMKIITLLRERNSRDPRSGERLPPPPSVLAERPADPLDDIGRRPPPPDRIGEPRSDEDEDDDEGSGHTRGSKRRGRNRADDAVGDGSSRPGGRTAAHSRRRPANDGRLRLGADFFDSSFGSVTASQMRSTKPEPKSSPSDTPSSTTAGSYPHRQLAPSETPSSAPPLVPAPGETPAPSSAPAPSSTPSSAPSSAPGPSTSRMVAGLNAFIDNTDNTLNDILEDV